MPKIKPKSTRGGVRKKAGRKRLADLGREKRERKVLVAFTPSEFDRVELEADDEGVTVSELVRQRAVSTR